MSRLALASLAAAVLAIALAGAAPAGAATAPCITDVPSATCLAWYGHVTGISDGDTLEVDIDGDGAGPQRIRITGINAMEIRHYSHRASRRYGDCHAVEAAARLEQLVRAARGAVRLTARHADSRSGARLRRSVAVYVGGNWLDVGRVLLIEGHALWLPNRREWATNSEYSLLAEQAARVGVGVWNPAFCGRGPFADAPLALWVNADASGRDKRHLNGEWVKIKNLDPAVTVALDGWWLRDSFLERYRFPRGAVLAPGATITVHVGRGRDHGLSYHWGQRHAVFENPVRGRRVMGDGAYLFDPLGNVRASMIYPCRAACLDPSQGMLAVRPRSRGRESITLRNFGPVAIDLQPYRLESPPYVYSFPAGTVLQPGGKLRIRIGRHARIRPGMRRWRTRGHILDDRGDVVRLTNYRDVVVACAAWGRKRC